MKITPKFAKSFQALAAALEMNRGWLHEIRIRDSRFPQRSDQGWPIMEVCEFFHLRELEQMTDQDFNQEARERARQTLGKIKVGDFSILGAAAVARLTAREEATLRGESDLDPASGRTARECVIAEIDELLNHATKNNRRKKS